MKVKCIVYLRPWSDHDSDNYIPDIMISPTGKLIKYCCIGCYPITIVSSACAKYDYSNLL